MNKKISLFYFSSIFLLLLIFTDLLTSSLYILLLILFNLILEKTSQIKDDKAVLSTFTRLIINSIFALGFFQILWLFFALFSKSMIRTYLIISVLIFLYLFLLLKGKSNRFSLSKFNFKEMFIYIFILFVLVIILLFPFKNFGELTQNGLAYRAYFSSDYLKHFSVIKKITDSCIPPQNPYFNGSPLHYYWLPYSFPSFIYCINRNIKDATTGWSIIVNFLFLLVLFHLILCFFKFNKNKKSLSLIFTFIPVLFLSLEGFYLFITKFNITEIFNILSLTKNYNIDALTRWIWKLPEIDTLLRSLFYTPQHLLSLTFFVTYLFLKKNCVLKNNYTILLIFFSLASSIFIGIGFLIVYSSDIFYDILNSKNKCKKKECFYCFIKTISFSAFAMFLFYLLKILVLNERKIIIKFVPFKFWFLFLFLNFGFIFIFGIVGAILKVKKKSYLLSSSFLLAIILTFRIKGFESDISLKLSLILIILFLITSIEFLTKVFKKKQSFILLLCFFLFSPAIFTSIIDIFNSSDINSHKFTLYIPQDEFILLKWIDKKLPKNTIIQNYPPVREPYVSIIPTFAGRDMFVGDRMHGRIFLTNEKKYNERISLLNNIFKNIEKNRKELKKLNIDYIFWGQKETKYFGYVPKLNRVKKIKNTYIFKTE